MINNKIINHIIITCLIIILICFALLTRQYIILVIIGVIPLVYIFSKPEKFIIFLFLTLLVKDINILEQMEITIGLKVLYLFIVLFLSWTFIFKQYKLKWRNIFFPLILFAGLYIGLTLQVTDLTSYVTSSSIHPHIKLLSHIALMLASYFLFIMLMQSNNILNFIKSIFHWMAISSIFLNLTIIGLVWFSVVKILNNPSYIRVIVALTFRDPNYYANTLLHLIFWTLTLIVITDKPHLKKFYWVAITLQMIVLIFSFSRGAQASLILSPILYVFLFQKKLFSLKIKTTIFPTCILFILFFFHMMISTINYDYAKINEFFLKRVTNVSTDNSASSRIVFWQVGLEMANDNPLGYGPHQYYYQTPKYRYLTRLARLRATHNDWVYLLVNTGIFGLLLWISFIIAIIYKARQNLNRTDINKKYVWLLKGTILCFLSFLLQGLTIDLFDSPHIWLNISIIIALIYRPLIENSEGEENIVSC